MANTGKPVFEKPEAEFVLADPCCFTCGNRQDAVVDEFIVSSCPFTGEIVGDITAPKRCDDFVHA